MPKIRVLIAALVCVVSVAAVLAHAASSPDAETAASSSTTGRPVTPATAGPAVPMTLEPEPSTTTAPPVTQTAHSGSGTAAGQVGDVPCGDDLPPCCVVVRESQGSWTALNPTVIDADVMRNPDGYNYTGTLYGAGGGYQFIMSTWWSYGGDEFAVAAHLASPADQMTVARRAWADWPGHWSPRCW